MSEEPGRQAPVSPVHDASPAPLDGEPIGAYLAMHRRLRGISLAELAEQTRIPLRSMERLESGAFDGEADGFVRGFVRTVAIALGLDPDEVVARMQGEPGGLAGRRPMARLSLARVLLVLALIVLAGGAVTLLNAALQGTSARSGETQPLTVRRDPVRALADAQGVGALHARTTALAVARSYRSDAEAAGGVTALEEASPATPISRAR